MSKDDNLNQKVDLNIICTNIKRLRIEKDISHEDLAEKLDVCTSHIYKLESGKSRPSLELLFKIRNIFQCSFDELLTPKKDVIKIPMSKDLITAIGQFDKELYDEFVDVIRKMEDIK